MLSWRADLTRPVLVKSVIIPRTNTVFIGELKADIVDYGLVWFQGFPPGSLPVPRAGNPRANLALGDPPGHLAAHDIGVARPFPRLFPGRAFHACSGRGGNPRSLGLANERRRRRQDPRTTHHHAPPSSGQSSARQLEGTHHRPTPPRSAPPAGATTTGLVIPPFPDLVSASKLHSPPAKTTAIGHPPLSHQDQGTSSPV